MFIVLKKDGREKYEVAQAETKEAAEKLRDSLAKQFKAEYVVEEDIDPDHA